MSTGYSLRTRDYNDKADISNLGVRLGRLCIAHNVSVSEVAKHMGVTRATVYNWFCGASAPQANTAKLIEAFISTLER
jgi:transcriptional regulator with XRE-family HTH domain